MGIKRGHMVTIKREDDGSLRIFPGIGNEQKEAEKSVINADMCDEPGMLTRILTGNYILGHDTVHVVSKKGVKFRTSTGDPEHCSTSHRHGDSGTSERRGYCPEFP